MEAARLITEQMVRDALQDSNGSPTRAAEQLGVSRMTVWRAMRRYGIPRVVHPSVEPRNAA